MQFKNIFWSTPAPSLAGIASSERSLKTDRITTRCMTQFLRSRMPNGQKTETRCKGVTSGFRSPPAAASLSQVSPG